MREKLANLSGLFLILLIAGIVIGVVCLFIASPWGTKLGAPGSAARTLWAQFAFVYAVSIPLVLYVASLVAKNPEWIAPRGRYMPGQEPKLFNTYTYTAIAFTAALFAAAGVLHFQVVDLPAAAAALGIMYFNPIIGFFTLWLGGILRAMIFGQGNPVQWAYLWGIYDGSTWIVLGIAYWWMREKTSWGKSPVKLSVGWGIFYWVWRTVYLFPILVWYMTPNLYIPQILSNWSAQMPTGLAAALAMLWIVEGLIRATQRQGATSPKAPAA